MRAESEAAGAAACTAAGRPDLHGFVVAAALHGPVPSDLWDHPCLDHGSYPVQWCVSQRLSGAYNEKELSQSQTGRRLEKVRKVVERWMAEAVLRFKAHGITLWHHRLGHCREQGKSRLPKTADSACGRCRKEAVPRHIVRAIQIGWCTTCCCWWWANRHGIKSGQCNVGAAAAGGGRMVAAGSA